MGKIRGKRNRDSDRFWHERRKSSQSGMVGVVALGEPAIESKVVSADLPKQNRRDLKTEKKAVRAAVALAIVRRGCPRLIRKSLVPSGDVPFTDRIRWQGPLPQCRESFAHYLFSGSTYPEFDYRDLDIERAAYIPPRLTVDYSQVYDNRVFQPVGEFGRLNAGSRGSTAPAIKGFGIARDKDRSVAQCALDHFGSHRPWQELIGEQAPNVKLTEKAVVDIRYRYAAGGISQMKLAKEFGISQGTINGIIWGSLWIYAPGPVKVRQVMRARCTSQTAVQNVYGERTYTERHPKPDILTETERTTLNDLEERREQERYVSSGEVKAWTGNMPIAYENGVYYPVEQRFVLDPV